MIIIGNPKKIRDHKNNMIVKIGKNTLKRPGDISRFALIKWMTTS